ncbi:MAG: hypothetical protein H6717_38045 [Polyangiaceae bacterium]|nr:hypothetical protein [Polyangiaceae bacterium]
MTRSVALVLVFLALIACKQGSADTAPSTTPPAPTPSATEPAPAPSAATLDPEIEKIAKEIVPQGIPTERSKPPTVAEWNAASEITVRHSGPLGCETKRVREWLRVSCRTSGSSGPQIQTVSIREPTKKDPEYFTYENKGVASIVLPLRQGMNAKIAFTWTQRGSRMLTATWPKGAPAPGIYFDQSANDGTAAKDGKPKCRDVCGGDRGFPMACETSGPCPKNFKCLDNHICICTIPCDD